MTDSFVLRNDSSFVLRNDGSKIIRNGISTVVIDSGLSKLLDARPRRRIILKKHVLVLPTEVINLTRRIQLVRGRTTIPTGVLVNEKNRLKLPDDIKWLITHQRSFEGLATYMESNKIASISDIHIENQMTAEVEVTISQEHTHTIPTKPRAVKEKMMWYLFGKMVL